MKAVNTMNVLIVEDEEKIGELIKIFLESQFKFNSIVMANSALVAAQKCQNQHFDIIIIDHVMPGRAGLEFIEKVKDSPRFQNTKFIVISGYLEQNDVLKAINIGIKNIVVKPFSRKQLIEHMEEALRALA